MLTYKITTLGCKVNQSESEDLALRLATEHFQPAANGVSPDLHIVNTCTVTGKAAMQSRQAVRRALRLAPSARVVVTGCYARTAAREIERIGGIDIVCEERNHQRIVEQILGLFPTRILPKQPQLASAHRSSIRTEASENRSRAFLKIQDGCEAFCSYCIVPYARGPSKSEPPDAVLARLNGFRRAGYREVVLTGIHLGCYGQDLSPATDLLSLLERIRELEIIDRIRLSSIEPRELSDALLRFCAAECRGPGRICPHFHLPLQSGDDGILKRMRRPYTSRFFRAKLETLRQLMPHAAVGVDVLVGFPGETEAAFEHTCRLVAASPITYLHVFPFSARPGTPAFHFPNRVPEKVIRERCRILREIGIAKKKEYYHKFIHKKLEVVVETCNGKASGGFRGTSANYIPVDIHASNGSLSPGALIEVFVERIGQDLVVHSRPAHPDQDKDGRSYATI